MNLHLNLRWETVRDMRSTRTTTRRVVINRHNHPHELVTTTRLRLRELVESSRICGQYHQDMVQEALITRPNLS